MYNQLSEQFPITSGVRQACSISPFLFNFAVDTVLGGVLNIDNTDNSLNTDNFPIDLDYADNIAIIDDNAQIIQEVIDRITTRTAYFGLCFSPTKCRVLIQDWTQAPPAISVSGTILAVVDSFIYLASVITWTGSIEHGVYNHISRARITFAVLQHLWRREDVSLTLKSRVYRASVCSVPLYGCEAWSLRVGDINRLLEFSHRCLHSISRTRRREHKSNTDIRQRV